GGSLTLAGALTVNGNTVTAGAGAGNGGNGSAFGSGLFLQGSGTITFAPGAGETQFVRGAIADEAGSGGPASNRWGLAKTGAGALILSESNYSGATAVDGGTLQAARFNALSARSAFTVASGAVLDLADFNQTIGSLAGAGNVALGSATLTTGNDNTSTTFSGMIAGTGGLTKIGSGTLTLAGSNTYTGATAVMAGTLQAGATNVFARDSAFTVASAAVLNLANFNQTIGSLAGAGNVMLGAGNLTLGSDNTSTEFSGTISGTGGLTKMGSGTLTLSGANTFTGGIVINGGEVVDNTDNGEGPVTVNSGGTIGGNGVLTSLTLNGGTLSPGNSIGRLTVLGNLVMNAAATYLVEVSPSNADRVDVGGTANVGGTVIAVLAPGVYSPRSYTILSASGGLKGTFDALTILNPPNFAADLSYTPTDVLLTLTAALGRGTPLGRNQQNVAGAIDGVFNNAGALPPNFTNLYNLTGSSLSNALSQLSGEAATGAQQVGFQLTNQFLGIMLDPFVDGRSGVAGAAGPALGFAPEREALPEDIALAYTKVLKAPPKPPSFEQRWSVWGAGYGGSNRTSGDPAVVGSHDLSARAAGGAAGLDYHLSRNSLVGFALAGGGTNWSLAQGLGGGKSDAFQAGVYGATRWGPTYLAAALAYTNHWMSTDRFAFAGDHLTASFNAQSFGARAEGGYRFATIYGGLTPYAAIQWQNFRTPSYSEADLNGGGFALAFNGRTGTDTRSELGARF
ncbi:MAG TPA: autotransporter domain-containing protein, partial [Xanthobacteraceae bacterium]|nr:autotransporter domain-containing protein [Xanthobacteraceae bacterium]